MDAIVKKWISSCECKEFFADMCDILEGQFISKGDELISFMVGGFVDRELESDSGDIFCECE